MDASSATRSSPSSPPSAAEGGAAPARVLLVDDSPANLLALAAVLEPLPVQLHMAANGLEALRLLLHQDYAVVVLDVNLPGGVSGFEVARLLRERERTQHTPLIFVTGKELAPGSVSQGYAHGAVDYLLKPVDPDALRSKVYVFAELHRMREELKRQAEVIRQQERTLLEQEQRARLHLMLSQAPAAIAIMRGEDFVYEFANPMAERIAGRPLTLGRPMAEVMPELAAQPAKLLQLREVLRTGRPSPGRRVQARVARTGGAEPEDAFFDVSYLPLQGPGGEVEGVISFAVDVTGQVQGLRRAEALAAELRDSEELFRSFFQLARVPMAQADLESQCLTHLNPAFCELAGRTEAQLLGLPFLELSHPEDRALDVDNVAALLRGDIPVYVTEKRYLRPDGGVRWVLVTCTLLRAADGRPLRIAAVVQDLTERKQVEAAREAGEQQLRLLTDALPVLVAYVDPEQRYRQANRAYQTWFGLEPEALLGRAVREVAGERAYAKVRPYMEAALRGEPQSFEQELPYPTGTRHVRALYIPHRLASGEVAGFIGLATDVTEQVRQA
jgi:PAS domain S-box-containing protein